MRESVNLRSTLRGQARPFEADRVCPFVHKEHALGAGQERKQVKGNVGSRGEHESAVLAHQRGDLFFQASRQAICGE